MDKDFISSLEFLTTDVAWRISTTDVVAEFEEHFCHPTQVVARDAMDILCAKEGLEGSPKVSKGGGNVKAYYNFFHSNTKLLQ